MPHQTFTTTRTTEPDLPALLVTVRAAVSDPAAALTGLRPTYVVEKSTDWSPAEIADVQAAINTAPALTAQKAAQNSVDAWPIELRALALALVDQLNVIRANLPTPLPAITPAQAIAAIRNKAGQL